MDFHFPFDLPFSLVAMLKSHISVNVRYVDVGLVEGKWKPKDTPLLSKEQFPI